MNHSPHVRLALGIALLATSASAQIAWAPRLEAAMEAAKTQKQVVFVSVNMIGERENDDIVAKHFRDARIAQLSKLTTNLFCSADAHKNKKLGEYTANDTALQTLLEAEKPVAAPQQIFFGPDGKVLLSVTGALTIGELEWMWVEALREVDPTFTWAPTGRTRAPAKVKRGEANKDVRAEAPPTKKQMQKALKDIKKLSIGGRRGGGRGGRGGRGGWGDMMAKAQENSRILIRSADKKALDWGRNTLRGYRMFRNGLLRDIGTYSPRVWAPVLQEFLKNDSGTTRKAAAMALEKLHSPKATTALRRAAMKEEEVDIHGRILRALAASAPTKKPAIRTITKAATAHEESILRCHALIATGLLEDRAAITKTLSAGLQDEDPTVRTMAAYVIAIRQDRAMLEILLATIQSETDSSVKEWMDKAVNAVRTGKTDPFEGFLGKTLDGSNQTGDRGGRRGAGGGRGGARGGAGGGRGGTGGEGTGKGDTGKGDTGKDEGSGRRRR